MKFKQIRIGLDNEENQYIIETGSPESKVVLAFEGRTTIQEMLSKIENFDRETKKLKFHIKEDVSRDDSINKTIIKGSK